MFVRKLFGGGSDEEERSPSIGRRRHPGELKTPSKDTSDASDTDMTDAPSPREDRSWRVEMMNEQRLLIKKVDQMDERLDEVYDILRFLANRTEREVDTHTDRKKQNRTKKRKPSFLLTIYFSALIEEGHAKVLREELLKHVPEIEVELCGSTVAQKSDLGIVVRSSNSGRLDMPENEFLKMVGANTQGNVISVKTLQSNDPHSAPYNPKSSTLAEAEVFSGIGLNEERTVERAVVFLTFNFPLHGESRQPFILSCNQNQENLGKLVNLVRKVYSSKQQ